MRAAVLLLLALAACKSDPPPPSVSPSPVPAPAPAPAPSTPSASASASASPPASTSLVDLLRATPAVVAVSSNVNNPRDFPEHLVDGKMDTAWNSRTGDLHGWMAFSVPDDAIVVRLELAAGYAKGDLFTKNHRLTKVRVSRENADDAKLTQILEAALDPESQALQPIVLPPGTAGGRFRIEVTGTLPGTEPKWRELVVSELRVLGTPGKTVRAAPTYPLVSVGALAVPRNVGDAEDVPYTVRFQETSGSQTANEDWLAAIGLLDVPAKSATAFLASWNKLAKNGLRDAEEYVPKDHRAIDQGPLAPGFVPTAEVKALHKILLFGTHNSFTLVGVDTSRGFEISGVPLDNEYYMDPGCFGSNESKLTSVRAEAPRSDKERGVVVVELESTWTNSRTFADENGKLVNVVYPKDTSHQRFECVLMAAPDAPMQCAMTVTSRACGTVAEPVACDSY